MTSQADIDRICEGSHHDPFSILGPHVDAEGRLWVRAFLPGAEVVEVVDAKKGSVAATLERREAAGFFEGLVPRRTAPFPYRLRVQWPLGETDEIDDPYRFGVVLSETDVWLLGEGTHLRPYEVMGAHPRVQDGVAGTAFAVWAPNASRVSVVGDFNQWDGRRHPMRLQPGIGVWELFLPGIGVGTRYKYEVRTREGVVLPQKADPYGFYAEVRPATASVVVDLVAPVPPRPERQAANALDAPISIYEVHPGSWRRVPEDGSRWMNWDELRETLIPYVRDLGFTHLELMPIHEHPFDGSWGYQPVGLYAPTSRFGPPESFQRFVDACHEAGLGVLIDWVPGHFPTDAHGLGAFDGTHLYEHGDPREGFHQDWNTLIYNFGRTEVRNYLIGNALYWTERFGVDGLRVDAVASMLYRDYSRKEGEWVPNIYGGRENLEAISFLRRMNEVVGVERPTAITVAEESTAFPAVSRPVYAGGLGFYFKWNMGWMHDTLAYMQHEPVHRRYHHNELTFGLVYAFSENYVLPLSHDEVVHGKGSLLGRMPGDEWQRFANLRAYYGFMWTHPGKKLLFMGGEFAQPAEWNHDTSLDWHLLDYDYHRGVQSLVRDLNRYYQETPALYECDADPAGFAWLELHDADQSVLAYLRRGTADTQRVVVVCNFTPVVRHGYRIGVPLPGRYREVLNTDSMYYGGSNAGNGPDGVEAEPIAWAGQPWSVALTLPPLATILLEWNS